MADATRTPRELETRDSETRKKPWKPATLLPEPNPRPGWAHKYIRISVMGQNDPTNTAAMFREGWEPVKAEEYPELMVHSDGNPNSRYKDGIEIGGLLLCRAPEEMVEQRREYYANMNRAQIEGVDRNFMRANDPRMPMEKLGPSIERRSTTTFGRGNKP